MTRKAPRSRRSRAKARGAARYDGARAGRYWGSERLRLGDEFAIVLSAGEPHYVNQAYHRWEMETLLRGLGSARERRVLDLACGLGRVSRVLAGRGARVVGMDNAWAMLLAARRSLRRAGARSPSWAQAVSHRLPFRDASFRDRKSVV